jgi:hypothetical protein
MDLLDVFLSLLKSAPQLAVIGLLSYVVYLLVAKKGPVKQIGLNHLHELPEAMELLREIHTSLQEIRDGINWLKGRAR